MSYLDGYFRPVAHLHGMRIPRKMSFLAAALLALFPSGLADETVPRMRVEHKPDGNPATTTQKEGLLGGPRHS